MDKVVKVINGLIHTSGCTLRCDYCYLVQGNHLNVRGGNTTLKYPLETVLKACSKKRLGGTALFQIIGDGETLLPEDVVPLIHGLLREGHYVRVITNGTLRDKIQELVEKAEKDGLLGRLMLSFSLHFLELEKRNLLERFASNVKYAKEKGVSFFVSIVASDECLEAAERIHAYCEQQFGGG